VRGKPILLFLLSIFTVFSIYCSGIAYAADAAIPDLVCIMQKYFLGCYEPFVDREIKGLVILVKFLDDTEDSTYNTAEIDNFFNQTDYNNYGCNGSVKDYFYDVSDGNLILTHDIVGYFTTLKNRSDYEEQSGTAGAISEPIVKQALEDLRDTGYDFSTLSTDSDGNVLSINVIYPGKTADPEINTGLWPHAGWIVPDLEIIDDVVFARKYTFLTLEFYDDDISTLGSVHEIGHALLHLPDLADVEIIYGTDSCLATSGNGYYDFMGLGGGDSDNPPPPNAYLRYRLGWETVTDITNATPGQTFTINSNTNTSYRYSHSNGTEYFLIESRTKTGRNAAL
jgi:M6 family metalloprotease-like protein